MKQGIECYIATYIQDANPATGDYYGDLEACPLYDEDGELLYGDTYTEMWSLCMDDAEFYINNSAVAEERGYHIIETNCGIKIVDEEEYPIVTYNIHDISSVIKVKSKKNDIKS